MKSLQGLTDLYCTRNELKTFYNLLDRYQKERLKTYAKYKKNGMKWNHSYIAYVLISKHTEQIFYDKYNRDRIETGSFEQKKDEHRKHQKYGAESI